MTGIIYTYVIYDVTRPRHRYILPVPQLAHLKMHKEHLRILKLASHPQIFIPVKV